MLLTGLVPEVAVLASAVLVALALDFVFGEPPAWLHPVVAMGHYLSAVGRRVSRAAGALARPAVEFWAGALGWCVGAVLMVAVAFAAVWTLHDLHPLLQSALLGLWLKPMLSWRMLRDEVQAVETALAESLEAGRTRVGWLVSRDVTALSESQVREAAVSTLAENLNDSVWRPCSGSPLRACRAPRSTVLPTPPTPCGATGANAAAATGPGPANGLRGWMTRCPGCPRASRPF